MHEMSIATAVLDTAARHADGRRVSVIRVRAGRLRQVVPDSLAFYIELLGRGGPCEGARLEMEVVPATLQCAPCAHSWGIEIPAFRCPRCGGSDGVTVLTGEELEVESIEVEQESTACTA